MLSTKVQQQLFDKYAPTPTKGQWNIQRLADTITNMQSPNGDILRKYLFRLSDDCIKTRIHKTDIYEFIVANDCWLFVVNPVNLKKNTTYVGHSSVKWDDVTDQTVEQYLNDLAEYFKTLN